MATISERDIYIQRTRPALVAAGWGLALPVRQEVSFTEGRVIRRGKLASRGTGQRADRMLQIKPNISLAVPEAKDGSHLFGDGIE